MYTNRCQNKDCGREVPMRGLQFSGQSAYVICPHCAAENEVIPLPGPAGLSVYEIVGILKHPVAM